MTNQTCHFLNTYFMSIKYIVIEKGNLAKPEEPQKFYAQAKSNDEVSFRLSREIPKD